MKFAGDNRDTIGNNTYSQDGNRYNYSQVVTDLTAYDQSNVSEATNKIDSIVAGGATAADRGMAHAAAVLKGREGTWNKPGLVGARKDAQRVVIFFTDGEPNHQNGFEPKVANDAISQSRSLKQDGALVYSIGVFAEADPSDTIKNFNAYMHGVSSNYPNATSYRNLGSRVEKSDYYKAATDAAELNGIFQEISDEINKGAGSPTEAVEGMANKSGYITFTDELGAYMQVDGFKTLVFADKTFEPVQKMTEGFVDTYIYEGFGGTSLYPNGNVKDIIVKVQRSNDLAQGDIVSVKIPASLIPLRNFKVESKDAGSTMEIVDAHPLRIFYGVSVKPGVSKAILDGSADDALRAYIKNNSKDGKVDFYSNLFDGKDVAGDKLLGNTTATFEPSNANSFYYFTEDTALYIDERCEQPLCSEPVSGETYYYKRAYYKYDASGNAAVKDWAITQFNGANFDALTTYWRKAPDGTYYIAKGSPRLTRIDSLTLTKTDNKTNTATEVINPHWDNINNPYEIIVNLGNNGKLSVEMPGALAIAKDARIAPDKNISPDVLADKRFKFEVSIPSAAGKTFKADVRNSRGEIVAATFDMRFDQQGKRMQELKDDETLYIYGLDGGANYAVTEKDIPAGFTQTNATGATGTISANTIARAEFENTYDVAATTVGADELAKYKKVFDKWEVAGSFCIQLKAVQAGNPMPEGSTFGPDNRGVKIVTVTKDSFSGNFGDIVFKRPGTFDYTVSEITPTAEDMVPGVTYSDASYNVHVEVVDNGAGELTATASMTKTTNDAGAPVDEKVGSKVASFTNSFHAEETSAGPLAEKSYTNNGGVDSALASGMFTFKVKPLTAGAPIPEGMRPDADGYVRVTNSGTMVAFGQAAFGEKNVGNTYVYEICEAMPAGATAENGYTVNGMTYDPTVYRAKFKVTSGDVADYAKVKVAISYYKLVNGQEEPLPAGQAPEFLNAYDPTDVTLPGDANAALRARKTLKGRDAKAGESFAFTLFTTEPSTESALEKDEIVFADDPSAVEMTSSVSDLKNGVPGDAPFGKVAFSKPGVYKFKIRENAPADGDGMTYDRSIHEVTVGVTDEAGVLKADVRYTGAVKDAAEFTNVYEAQCGFGAGFELDVAKTLNGRRQEAGEFGFVIEGVASDGVTAEQASKRLDVADAKFTTVAPADSGAPSLMSKKLDKLRFTQADAGKTFSYVLHEDVPAGDKKLGGVTYDETTYRVDIRVVDNADGTLKTVTTVIKNAAGAAPEPVGTFDSSDGRDVVTLGFTNEYAARPVSVDETNPNLRLYKVLEGRDWREGDVFHFVMKGGPAGSAPVEKDVVADPGTKAGEKVSFNFGGYTFTQPGEYYYTITESKGDVPGITYSKNVADIVVSVTDNLKGQLEAQVTVHNDTFTNAYATKPVNPDGDGAAAKGGIQIVKTLAGRPIAAGDFEFTMAPADDATKAKFGDAKVIKTNAAELGTDKETSNTATATTSVKTGIEFTLEDVGKTYTLRLSETKGGDDGYVNDKFEHVLKLTTADNGDGTLSVTVTLDNERAAVWTSGAEFVPVSVRFANSYSAASITVGGQGGVALTGTKQLTGRPMVAGEFRFNVTNAKDEASPAAVVATGTNAADGTITFSGIEYTTEKLNSDVAAGLATVNRTGKDGDVYTYAYNVSEDATKNDQGISIVQGTQAITVKVTDNRAGKLSAEVAYPDGGMVFKNAYGTGADGTKVIALNGTKVLDVRSGNKVPDIAGKYTFTLTGSEGAPMPVKTTATNDAAGNISFGEITYTMENVFGAPAAKPEQPMIAEDEADAADAEPAADESAAKAPAADEPMASSAQRERVFTYTVAEHGVVSGVTNDPVATKTITVKVTDNGDGTLSVDKRAESAKTDFTFTNTYGVKPFDSTLTGEGGFTVIKTLSGRDLREGEFEFALVPQAEGDQAVLTAKNDTSGKVAFPAISFSAPGEYHYTLAEIDAGLGGVTYDAVVYDVTATVVDNGDGTLGVTWSVSKGGQPLEGKQIVFANSYKAAGTSITFNAAKVLTGRDLKKGEFTFELRDANGKVLQTVKNGAPTEGGYAPIAFDPIAYDEPGTHDYRIVEVAGDAEGVTYDETVFTYHVVVTDDGGGKLKVEWTAGETGAPVFQNVFVKSEDPKPVDPAKPADPGNGGPGDKLVQTGDSSLLGIAAAAAAGALAMSEGIVKRRKSE